MTAIESRDLKEGDEIIVGLATARAGAAAPAEPAGRAAAGGRSERAGGRGAARHRDREPHARLQDGRDRGARARRRDAPGAARRVPRRHGPVGLGEVHVHEHRRLPRPADRGAVRPRGRGRLVARARRARRDPQRQDRVRLPELQPPLAHVGARERRAPAPLLEEVEAHGRGGARPRDALPRARGPQGPLGPHVRAALGRAAAARRDRAEPRERARDPPRGRADGQPRLEDVRGGHGDLPGPERRGQDRRPHHARAGHRAVRPAHRHVPRREGPERRARHGPQARRGRGSETA